MEKIQAIETKYRGYRFRSRLEARWAVFFDALDLNFEYEKEGFDLGEVGYYLPDFWLPTLQTWVEIKPSDGFDKEDAVEKCHALAVGSQTNVLLIEGNPGEDREETFIDYEMTLFGGMPWDMFIKKYPYPNHDSFEHAWMQGHHLFEELRQFVTIKVEEGEYLGADDVLDMTVGVLDERARRKAIVELDRLYYFRKYGKEHPHRRKRCSGARWRFRTSAWIEATIADSHYYSELEPQIKRALTLARSARFEHGEQGFSA